MNRRKHLLKGILSVLFIVLSASTSQVCASSAQEASSPLGTESTDSTDSTDNSPLSTDRPAIGIRTNLLSWAVLSPSLGIDLQWGTRWQAGIDGSIGLMSTDHNHGNARYARVSGVGVELRRYFYGCYRSTDTRSTARQCQSHHGPYLAIDARMLKFDAKLGSEADATGREGYLYTAGLTLGYTFWLPGALTIDLAAGAGYLRRDYNRYTWYAPKQQYRLLAPRADSKFGLTHAEISLVYHFKL